MVVSGSKERADAFSSFCLRLIYDVPELMHLAPRSDQRSSLIAFDVNGAGIDHSPSVKSVGITGQLTGSRADIIVADDVETPRNSQTVLQREKLEALVMEFDAILKPLPTSRIIYLGTPQVEDSLYNKLAQKGYTFRIWPARMPDPKQRMGYGGKLAPFIENMQLPVGDPTDPKRFSAGHLVEVEASYGRSGFALQFQLDTSLSDLLRYPLRCSDMIVMDTDREVAPVKVSYGSGTDQLLELECVGMKGDRWYSPLYISKDFAEYQGSVLFVDPSGRGADRTAVVVVKMLNGMLYLRRAINLPGGYDEMTLMAIARLAQIEKVNEIVCEENYGGGMFNQLLKPVVNRIYPVTISGVWHTKQKELRIIDTLEPVLNQHRLVVDKSIVVADMEAEPQHQLFHQLSRITRDKNSLSHDDLVDALAGAVAYWLDKLDADINSAEDRHKQDALDKELQAWGEGMGIGGRSSAHNWTRNV